MYTRDQMLHKKIRKIIYSTYSDVLEKILTCDLYIRQGRILSVINDTRRDFFICRVMYKNFFVVYV